VGKEEEENARRRATAEAKVPAKKASRLINSD
jgi:hypothetical protein